MFNIFEKVIIESYFLIPKAYRTEKTSNNGGNYAKKIIQLRW